MVISYPHIDPVLVQLGPIAIRWYAISYIVGILLSWWIISRALRNPSLWKNPPFDGKPPATMDDIGDLVVWATLGIIIGGRVGWDLFYGTILCSVSRRWFTLAMKNFARAVSSRMCFIPASPTCSLAPLRAASEVASEA